MLTALLRLMSIQNGILEHLVPWLRKTSRWLHNRLLSYLVIHLSQTDNSSSEYVYIDNVFLRHLHYSGRLHDSPRFSTVSPSSHHIQHSCTWSVRLQRSFLCSIAALYSSPSFSSVARVSTQILPHKKSACATSIGGTKRNMTFMTTHHRRDPDRYPGSSGLSR